MGENWAERHSGEIGVFFMVTAILFGAALLVNWFVIWPILGAIGMGAGPYVGSGILTFNIITWLYGFLAFAIWAWTFGIVWIIAIFAFEGAWSRRSSMTHPTKGHSGIF